MEFKKKSLLKSNFLLSSKLLKLRRKKEWNWIFLKKLRSCLKKKKKSVKLVLFLWLFCVVFCLFTCYSLALKVRTDRTDDYQGHISSDHSIIMFSHIMFLGLTAVFSLRQIGFEGNLCAISNKSKDSSRPSPPPPSQHQFIFNYC